MKTKAITFSQSSNFKVNFNSVVDINLLKPGNNDNNRRHL